MKKPFRVDLLEKVWYDSSSSTHERHYQNNKIFGRPIKLREWGIITKPHC